MRVRVGKALSQGEVISNTKVVNDRTGLLRTPLLISLGEKLITTPTIDLEKSTRDEGTEREKKIHKKD